MDRYLATLDHEELLVRRGKRSGLFCLVAVQSTALGPALGGCRMWTYDDSRAAVRDVLRLSRGMTLKAAVAGLPLGGGKGVIMLKPDRRFDADKRRQVLLDFADTVDALDGRYITAEDVGTSTADMEVVLEATKHVTGLPSGSGDPSPMTALGVFEAIRVAARHRLGTDDLNGRHVVVVGLGHVGSVLARHLVEAGARLTVSDVDPGKQSVAAALGATWQPDPHQALITPADILAPCALGGVLDDDSVPELQCSVVAGAANNQLATDRIADLLAARQILWAPVFVANAGGIINISVELEPDGYDAEAAKQRVLTIGSTMDRIFTDAAQIGATPLTAAMELARRRITEAQTARGW